MDGSANCVRTTGMGLGSAYGMRTGGMDGSKKAEILRTYYVHSPLLNLALVLNQLKSAQLDLVLIGLK